MDLDPVAGRLTTESRRRGVALISAGLIAALALALAPPAQAHEPYIAKAWGSNSSGKLGDGTTTGPEKCGPTMSEACSTIPVQVSGLSGVTAVAGGQEPSFALLESGSVMAWGFGGAGALGDGSTESSDVPVAVKGLNTATAISAGAEHGLALLSNGTAMAWGQNSNGQLGNGTFTSSDVPVAVCATGETAPCAKDLSEVTAIAAGRGYSLALLKNGTVMAWGDNGFGELGNGTHTTSSAPVAVCAAGEKAPCAKDLIEVVAIAAGDRHGLALLSSGTVMAWGSNGSGQLGNGTVTESRVPVAVSGLSEVAGIAGGGEHSLAVLKDGTVKAWGGNAKGQLGDGTSTGPENCGTVPPAPCAKTPVAVSGLGGVIAVAGGSSHSLALLKDGTVRAWGENGSGELGDGTSSGPEPCGPGVCSTKPVEAGKLLDAKGIAASSSVSLAFGPPPPTVTGISPNEPSKQAAKNGGQGTTVTITGAEFEEATEVKFGPNKATSVTVSENGTKITAVSPLGKGTVDVTVTTPAGTSPTSEADKFYYSRPAVKRLSPRKGGELGGTSVTINGVNFTGATAVKFGSTEATSFKVNSDTSITAVSPAHTSGRVDVTVATPNGTSAITNRDRFRYR